jgi:hypothetical protein
VAEEDILLSADLGWLSGKMERNTVLSVSPNKEKLIVRHTTLRDAGMKVVSVLSPAEARFEIQMGRCGSLLMCYHLSSEQANDIAKLYRRFCPKGRIVFVTEGSSRPSVPREADAYVPESNGAQELLQALRAA